MNSRITFDSLTLASVIDGLQAFCPARLQHIAQPEEHELILTVYAANYGEARWLINCSPQWARTHLVTRRRPNPPQPFAFCMTLRKYLEGGTIVAVRQRVFDRVMDVTIRGLEGQEYLLTVELMGRHSNIILVAPDGNILQAAKLITSKVNRVREILPGRFYIPAPAPQKIDPRSSTQGQFLFALSSAAPEDFAPWLRGAFEGISGVLAEEIDFRSTHNGIADKNAARWVAFDSIFSAVCSGKWQPIQTHDATGHISGAYPLPLQSRPASSQEPGKDIHSVLENYYATALPQALLEQQQRSLIGALHHTLSAKQHALRQVRQGTQERGRSAQYRQWGELILAHLYQIKKGQKSAELLDYMADPPTPLTVPMEPTQTPQQNAERYFQRARHVEQNATRLQTLQQQLEGETADLEALLAEVAQANETATLDKLRAQAATSGWLQAGAGTKTDTGKAVAQPKPQFEGKRIRSFTSPEGWTVLVGENAEANDYLTQRVARPNDWWLHVRAGTGSHVVIPTQNAPQCVPPSVLRFAAQLAAANSRARHSGLVAVDYTLRKYVRRPRGGAPGLVTFTHEKTIDVVPGE